MNTQEIARRLEIAAAAAPPVKDTRVVVKFAPNEWRLGNVVRSRINKVIVIFDNDSVETLPWVASKIKEPKSAEAKRINKKVLTDAQVKDLMLFKAVPSKTPSRKAPVKMNPRSPAA